MSATQWLSIAILILANITSIQAYGLYNLTDNVTVLNGDNVLPTLKNSTNLWLMEYYVHWCGHCQRFAPLYKALAKDVAEWYPVINLGVINCAESFNAAVCNKRNITGVPALRFHAPHANTSDVGEVFNVEEDIKYLRNGIVQFVERNFESVEWNYSADTPKPNFVPASHSEVVAYLSPRTFPEYVLHVALVFENNSSSMGKEMILDMSSCSNIIVRRVITNSEDGKALIDRLDIKDPSPNVLVISNNGTVTKIRVALKTRYFYVYQLKRLSGVGAQLAKPLVLPSVYDKYTLMKNPEIDFNNVSRGQAYLADIESGLRYMLTMEASATRVLDGGKLQALKNLIGLFAQVGNFFPGRATTIEFIRDLDNWLKPVTSISSEDWLKKVNEKTLDRFLPATSRLWVGCLSSESSLRGYPCSLWTIFHSMTVATYRAKLDKNLFFDAMYGFITNFFSCRECRDNFKKEVKVTPYKDTGDANDVILWLWRVHNKVNKRLHGHSLTEDYEFPKVQFPPKSLCPECQKSDNVTWNEDEVANYLINRYSVERISTEYMKEEIALAVRQPVKIDGKKFGKKPLTPANKIQEVQQEQKPDNEIWRERLENAFRQPSHKANDPEEQKRHEQMLAENEYRFHPRGLSFNDNYLSSKAINSGSGLGFSSLDFNLCLVIWFASLSIAIVWFLAFKVRRGWFRRLKQSKHH